MNIALFAHSGIFRSLQGLVRWLATSRSAARENATPSVPGGQRIAPKSIATHAVTTGASTRNINMLKPLRVVRVVEVGQSRTSVGRMVISGRMADVCAELDRLAAGEAALS
jgi:hypothetical protein